MNNPIEIYLTRYNLINFQIRLALDPAEVLKNCTSLCTKDRTGHKLVRPCGGFTFTPGLYDSGR